MLEEDVLAFDMSQLLQALDQSLMQMPDAGSRRCREHADTMNPSCRLRTQLDWPRGAKTGKEEKGVASLHSTNQRNGFAVAQMGGVGHSH